MHRHIAVWTLALVAFAAAGCANRSLAPRLDVVEQRLDQVAASVDEARELANLSAEEARASHEASARALEIARTAERFAHGELRHREVRTVHVYFDLASAELPEESRALLRGVVDEMREHPDYIACVTGYTDDRGDPRFNLELSRQRARNVYSALAMQLRTEVVRVTQVGLGEAHPAGSNDTPEGRRRNRRVEVTLLRGEMPEDAAPEAPAPQAAAPAAASERAAR